MIGLTIPEAIMTTKPVWQQISRHHFAVQGARRRIELRYESAGFRSAWSVYADGTALHHHPGFMEARGAATALLAVEG